MIEQSQQTTPEAPAPRQPRRKPARRAKPQGEPKPKKNAEFSGVTAQKCPAACTPDHCVISTVAQCKHPVFTADSGCGPLTIRNREIVRKIIKKQAIDAA